MYDYYRLVIFFADSTVDCCVTGWKLPKLECFEIFLSSLFLETDYLDFFSSIFFYIYINFVSANVLSFKLDYIFSVFYILFFAIITYRSSFCPRSDYYVLSPYKSWVEDSCLKFVKFVSSMTLLRKGVFLEPYKIIDFLDCKFFFLSNSVGPCDSHV